MYDFIADLDEYFCKKYANYDKLCVLSGYKMPTMQATEEREDGRTYAYTLPPETMSLANQENKTELLAALKAQLVDKTFSFSFIPYGFFTWVKNKFSKYAFYKSLHLAFQKYSVTKEAALENLNIEKEVWDGICNGKFQPTKNLLFSFALTAQVSFEDTEKLLGLCGYEFDYTFEKDVVVAYLLTHNVFNRGMIDAALSEYKIDNLFI
ncbi:MAG: hypothetical protein IJX87_02390 [Clostridia bacterium]|nr:hypothetical protein [Clostridia bacterium]